ncbi:hypothetical protein GCM10010492_03530 [Saccharothrix mutabilis subsp. mutabilis]|uniref:Uncharacterized protein n=1 Tax=Saccharothrix mutabilis subsp. mutabilis TaxID=66855 RepID=A0ABP3CL67_9PSEU
MTKWRVMPSGASEAWTRLFGRAWHEPGIRVDAACPNCGQRGLHQFYIRHEAVSEVDREVASEWLRERIRKAENAADGVEWCQQCRIFDHVQDKAAPPWWPLAVAEIKVSPKSAPEHVIDSVALFLAEHEDLS